MKLTELETSNTQRVVVYGGPKSGKTELVGKLAQYYNLLWFDLEKGVTTLLKMPTEWKERVNVVQIPDSRIFPIAIQTMLKVVKGLPVSICQLHGAVDCAMCKKDSAPVTRICLNEVTGDTIVVVDSLTQLTNSGIAHITKSQPDDYKLQLDDWGNLKVLVEKFLSQIQAAPYNVVCITHEEEVELEDGRKKIVPVCGSSKSSRNTAKYFDHVVYCDVKNKKHVAGSSTNYALSVLTGSRTDVRLEDTVSSAASLLDIFTSYKKETDHVPKANNTLDGSTDSSSVSGTEPTPAARNQSTGTSVDSVVEGENRTPAQIALDNLRKKVS